EISRLLGNHAPWKIRTAPRPAQALAETPSLSLRFADAGEIARRDGGGVHALSGRANQCAVVDFGLGSCCCVPAKQAASAGAIFCAFPCLHDTAGVFCKL